MNPTTSDIENAINLYEHYKKEATINLSNFIRDFNRTDNKEFPIDIMNTFHTKVANIPWQADVLYELKRLFLLYRNQSSLGNLNMSIIEYIKRYLTSYELTIKDNSLPKVSTQINYGVDIMDGLSSLKTTHKVVKALNVLIDTFTGNEINDCPDSISFIIKSLYQLKILDNKIDDAYLNQFTQNALSWVTDIQSVELAYWYSDGVIPDIGLLNTIVCKDSSDCDVVYSNCIDLFSSRDDIIIDITRSTNMYLERSERVYKKLLNKGVYVLAIIDGSSVDVKQIYLNNDIRPTTIYINTDDISVRNNIFQLRTFRPSIKTTDYTQDIVSIINLLPINYAKQFNPLDFYMRAIDIYS